MKFIQSVILSGVKRSRRICLSRPFDRLRVNSGENLLSYLSLIILLFLSACTDYVGQIDDQIEELKASQEKNVSGSSSSEEMLGNSSSMTSSSSTFVYGTLKDERDGKSYKTIVIGSQTWMAENLNYETMWSYCYDYGDGDCALQGLLYPWGAALYACPAGWHLPTVEEYETLFSAVGGKSVAAKKLKSRSGWAEGYNGTDDYGFSANPSIYREGYEIVTSDWEYFGYFWTATDDDGESDFAYHLMLYTGDSVEIRFESKSYWYPVRCLKGEGEHIELSSSSSVYNAMGEPLTDPRDGQIYKTVVIGEQTWMAENLNYAYTEIPYSYDGFSYDSTSWCYDNKADNCTKYGRLYTWAAAMDSAGTWSTNGKGCGYGSTCSPTGTVRGICPEGWHLPTQSEWNTLLIAVGGQSTAGLKLKSTSGWSSDGNGVDAYGFSALLAGYRDYEHYYVGTQFWSSTESGIGSAYGLKLVSYYERGADDPCDGDCRNSAFLEDGFYKVDGFSVRCLKGEDVSDRISSSSALQESSSSVSSSSSIIPAEPCKGGGVDTCEYGVLKDERDGQSYRAVRIGGQWWMTENLNYKVEGSSCYGGDNESNCLGQGRLYTWTAAMNDICPNGWHLPSKNDFATLFYATNETVVEVNDVYSVSHFDINAFGFVVPYTLDEWYFWSSTEFSNTSVYSMYSYYEHEIGYAGLTNENKSGEQYVRCVNNENSENITITDEPLIKSSWDYLNTKINYGEFTDPRDGRLYKTVDIGDATWFAENLDYGTKIDLLQDQVNDNIVEKYCYGNDENNCTLYGGLYQYTEAMALPVRCAEELCEEVIQVNYHQGICPEGWHIPTKEEFEKLIAAMKNLNESGKMLKSVYGWKEYPGTDDYGFSAIPVGYRYVDGKSISEHYLAFFWSATEYNDAYAYYMRLEWGNEAAVDVYGDHLTHDVNVKKFGISVRCVKDRRSY